MATSGAMSTSNQYVKYTIAIDQNSQNIGNNTSNVTVAVRFYRTNSGYSTYGTGTVYCKINGNTYTASVSPSQAITNSGIVLFTKTLNITHNNDGKKNLKCSAWISINAPLSSNEQSYSRTLTTIPRKSTLTASNGTLGTSQTLTINRHSTSFKHTITYHYAGASGTIVTKTTAGSVAWTPPLSLASQDGDATSVPISLTITTFDGSNDIGYSTKSIKCAVPASVKPTVSFTLTDAANLLGTYGGYLQNKSQFKVVISASGSYASQIKSYKTIADGKTYGASSFTGSTITGSGSMSVSVTVTDSRGRTATSSKTVTVIPYNHPRITAISATRCNSAGAADPNGTHLKMLFNGAISSVNAKNTATYTLKYKTVAATTWTTVTLSAYTGKWSVTNGQYIFPASASSSYNVQVTATDKFSSSTLSTVGAAGTKLLSLKANGRGIALGKVCEHDAFELGMDTYMRKGKKIFQEYEDGSNKSIIENTSTGALHFGVGGYHSNTGEGVYCGSNVRIMSKTNCNITAPSGVRVNGKLMSNNTVLWVGAYHMHAGLTITLADSIFNMAYGIVLVWSWYDGTNALDNNWNCFFIPLRMIQMMEGKAFSMYMYDLDFSYFCHKYLYIAKTSIAGHANNNMIKTLPSGLKFNAQKFVLRYVIGM